MMNLISTMVLTLASLFTLIGCGETAQFSEAPQKRTVKVRSKEFQAFFENFEQLTPCKINTCCIDVTQSKQYKEIDGSVYQKHLAHYQGPVIALGYLPDTLNGYGLVYCTAAATYLPNLALFDTSGELVQTVLLASGCGSDVAYDCKEEVVFNGKNQFITTKSERQYQIDETGNPSKELVFESNSKIKFTIHQRKIAIDTLTIGFGEKGDNI